MTEHAANPLPSRAVSGNRGAAASSPAGPRRRAADRRRAATVAGAIGSAVLALVLVSCGGGPSPDSSHQTHGSVSTELNRAVHEEVSGNEAQAVVDFLMIVKTDPRNQIAWYNLGVIAGRNGQSNQAERDYRAALGGDPHYVPALYNLAVLEAPAHPAQAVVLYRQVVRLQPKMAAAHLNLGFALEALRQQAAGKAQIASALKLDPSLSSRLPTGGGAG